MLRTTYSFLWSTSISFVGVGILTTDFSFSTTILCGIGTHKKSEMGFWALKGIGPFHYSGNWLDLCHMCTMHEEHKGAKNENVQNHHLERFQKSKKRDTKSLGGVGG